jgi:Flp pilus assembly protein TadD
MFAGFLLSRIEKTFSTKSMNRNRSGFLLLLLSDCLPPEKVVLISPGNHSMHRMNSVRSVLLISLIATAAVIFVYWPVQYFEFVNIDDHIYVVGNPHVREGLSPDGVRWAFRTLDAGFWHPLTWLSHMADVELYRLNPAGHHWTSVLIHAINTILLFLVLRAMTRCTWPSALVSALFALHPLHVESVSWVSERKDVLSGLLWFAVMGAYAWYVRFPYGRRYSLVVSLFVLGLMAKPMLVTLPFVLLLLDWWPLGRFPAAKSFVDTLGKHPAWLRLSMEKLPLLIITIAAGVTTYIAEQGIGGIGTAEQYPLEVRLANAAVSYGEYIWKMVWPLELSVMYPHQGMPPSWKIVAAILFLTAVSTLAIRHARRCPFLLVGWLWYLGTLLPVIGLVQVGYHAMADRYMYLPLVGLSIAVAWGAKAVVERRPEFKSCTVVIFLVTLTWLTWLARGQVETWKDSVTLFEHAVRATRVNPVAHNTLGTLYLTINENDCERAVPHFLKAVEQKTEYAAPFYNLGVCAVRNGNREGGLSYFHKSIELEPTLTKPRNDLGMLLMQMGKRKEAKENFQQILLIEPDHAAAHANLGLIFSQEGNTREADNHLAEALRINPRSAGAHNNLGFLRMKQGRMEEAAECFQKALELSPGNRDIERNLFSCRDQIARFR